MSPSRFSDGITSPAPLVVSRSANVASISCGSYGTSGCRSAAASISSFSIPSYVGDTVYFGPPNTFALLIASAGDPLVIPALNRDGDILSDLVLPLFGSIAGSESLLVAFEDGFEPSAIMAEAAHGTAPSLQGKNVANPMAMILAGAALLSHAGEEAQQAGRAIREGALEAVSAGIRTSDLGGHASTSEYVDEVISRVRTKLDVWSSL